MYLTLLVLLLPMDLKAEICSVSLPETLHQAAAENCLMRMKSVIDSGANVNERMGYFNATPLHYAAEKGNTKAIDLLLSSGADVNSRARFDKTPLHWSRGSELSSIEILVSHGADINSKAEAGETVIMNAAATPCIECVEFLLKSGADPNAVLDHGGGTALEAATFNQPLEKLDAMVKLLVKYGADPNLSWGASLLHLIVLTMDYQVIGTLVANGANPNVPDGSKNGPLHWVLRQLGTSIYHPKKILTVKALLDGGADVNLRGEGGTTPLITFSFFLDDGSSDMEILNLLIDRGAELNQQDEDGDSPLHNAAGKRHIETSKMLLARGANINLRNAKNETPLGKCLKADSYVSRELCDFLRKSGGVE